MNCFRTFAEVVVAGFLISTAAAQSTLGPSPSLPSAPSAVSPLVNPPQSPYLGSVSREPLHPGVLDLSIQQALERGLKANLGLFLSSTLSDKSRAADSPAIRYDTASGVDGLPGTDGAFTPCSFW